MRDYHFYIEQAKQKQGFLYDNQLDDRLGFKGSMMAIIKKGKKHLSEDKMLALAELAGIDEQTALADLNVLRSKDTPAHPFYIKIAEQVAHICLIAGFLIGISSTPSHANIRETSSHYGKPVYTLSHLKLMVFLKKCAKALQMLVNLTDYEKGCIRAA